MESTSCLEKTAQGVTLSKIGLSVDVHQRLKQHNADGYAGIFDWELHNWLPVDDQDLNNAEKAVHDMVKSFNVAPTSGFRSEPFKEIATISNFFYVSFGVMLSAVEYRFTLTW